MQQIFPVLCALLLTTPAIGAESAADWLFMIPDEQQPAGAADEDADTPLQLPGSSRSYTRAQIDDLKNPPDWFPDEHAPMPDVVAHGGEGMVFACASCHLASGMGHPESAGLAGLPVNYMLRQIRDFKSGDRRNPVIEDGHPQLNSTQYMVVIASAMTEQQAMMASQWFSSLKPLPWVQVVETETVPRTYVSRGFMRLSWPGGESEPIGNRIVELPQDVERQTMRDPHSGTIAYVPTGSVSRGETLVSDGGDGKTVQCAICHGMDLKGLGEVPSIAGRSPTYISRQLYSFKNGGRGGTSAALMQTVVQNLDEPDMISIAAYLGTLEP